jgi:GntR family transcriptional repressor for pyruvate dehydrogenase complex
MAEVLASELRTRILTRQLLPGASLLSEAALMEAYQVSRPTIREALRLLEAQRLISVRRGSHQGPTVSLPDITVAAKSLAIQLQLHDTTLADVNAFRRIFEPMGAALAAEQAADEDLETLELILRDGEAARGDFAAYAVQSWRFHLALITLSRNTTMEVVALLLQKVSEQHSTQSMAVASDPGRQQGESIRAHRRMIELLRSRDSAAAGRFWTRHMEAVSTRLIDSMVDTAIVELPD